MTIKEAVLPLADNYAQNYGSREYDHRAALIAALDAADREVEAFNQDHIERLLRIEQKVDALIAENAALRLDAERYQWLTADHPDYETRMWLQAISDSLWCRNKGNSDAAIDAARTALGEKT
jgi:hypothetical protein